MPREQINYPIIFDRSDLSKLPHNNNALGGPWNEPAVHVRWECGDGATPGMVFVQFEADAGHIGSAIKRVSITYTGTDGVYTEPPAGKRTVLSTDALNRAELNKLIRVLRRARDAAYGRDE